MNTELKNTAAFRNGRGRRKSSRIFARHSISSPSEAMVQDIEAIINRLTKWVVVGIFVGVLVWKKEAESLWLAMGSDINAIICLTLKRVLNQQRPDSTLKSDPGMPSSLAQSIFFFCVAILLSSIKRFGVNEVRMGMARLALACASYLSWLRAKEQYHTKRQVIIGGSVGSVFSVMWCRAWDSFVFKAFLSY